MKEKCWKQLKSQLCPKQKWVPDHKQSKCLCCGKKFKSLIRRKHHCRFCGSIFCSDCSDYFINGNYLDQKNQKHIRHCQFCHKKIEKFIRDWTQLPQVYDQRIKQKNSEVSLNEDLIIQETEKQSEFNQEQGDFQSSQNSLIDDFIDDSTHYEVSSILMLTDQNQESLRDSQIIVQNIQEQMNTIIAEFSAVLCQKWGIDTKHWKNKISELATRGAIETKMDPLANQGAQQNAMDIARKIKIKTILTQQSKAIQVIMKGIALQKNPPTKHVNIHLSKPKVLIIQKSIDLDSLTSFIKFEELIKNDKAIMKKILQKIIRLNPDIIFVEQNVHVFALQYLQSKQIVVVSKLKPKQIQLVKQITGIKKSVKKLWMLQRYKPSLIIGKCDKIYFKMIRPNQYMMFIEADVGMRTILIGQQTQDQVNTLKRTMQILLRIARQLNLQKHYMLTQRQIKSAIVPELRQNLYFLSSFSSTIYKNLQNYLMYQQVMVTKIDYRQIKISQSPKLFQQYGFKFGKTSYKQICGNPEYLNKKIYTSADMTLGGYFLLSAVNYDCERICKKCGSHHLQKYYINGYSVTINVQRNISNSPKSKKNSQEFKHNKDKQMTKSNANFGEQMMPELVLQQQNKSVKTTNFIIDQFSSKNQQITLQQLKSHLNKQKQIIIIEASTKCGHCGQNMSKIPIKLGKFYLSNSFYHVLHLLVIATSEADKLIESKKQLCFEKNKYKNRKMSLQKCDHSCLIRVFEYSGIFIEIQIEKVTVSAVNYVNLAANSSLQLIKSKQKKFIQRIYSSQIHEKRLMLERLIEKINNICLPLQNTSKSISFQANIGQKIKLYIDYYGKLKQILEKCQNQLKKQIQNKCFKDLQEQKNHDWTFYLRKILKIDSIIRMGFVMVQSMENNLKKNKIQQNIPISSKQNQVLLQYEDIKQLIDDDQTNQEQQSVKQSISHLSVSIAEVRNNFSQVNNQIRLYLKNNSKKRYPRMQGSYLHFHTANVNEPVGLLACGVNSHEYRKAYEEYTASQTIEQSNQNIVSNRDSGKENRQAFNFRLTMHKILKSQWPPKIEMNKLYSEIVGDILEKLEVIDFTVYYPRQFQQLRQDQNIDNQMYIRGLCTCTNWNSSGGKSNSLFAKSQNDLLVVKVINQKQFEEFLKFAKEYIIYLKQSKLVGRNTLLAKIYGIYEVIAKGKIYKCVVMQNIFFGINKNILKVYDLKGSQVNRLNVPPQADQKFTGQDTNFKIDRQGQPYILKSHQYDKLLKILQEDSNFLKEHAVIDYSLLVIQTKQFLRLGVIDYMRPYQLMQKLETLYKQFKSGRDPTVIPPGSYAERFLSAMKKYFIKGD